MIEMGYSIEGFRERVKKISDDINFNFCLCYILICSLYMIVDVFGDFFNRIISFFISVFCLIVVALFLFRSINTQESKMCFLENSQLIYQRDFECVKRKLIRGEGFELLGNAHDDLIKLNNTYKFIYFKIKYEYVFYLLSCLLVLFGIKSVLVFFWIWFFCGWIGKKVAMFVLNRRSGVNFI